jgi:hypothetical protein
MPQWPREGSAVHANADREGQRWRDRPSASTDPLTFSLVGIPYHTPPKNDWNGGAQTLVRLKVTFPGFEPLKLNTEHCMSLSPAFRPTTCTPIEFILRNGDAYEPPDDVRFNYARDLFHNQRPRAGPYGFELYETGPPEARIDTYRKDAPEHILAIHCFVHSKDGASMSVCHTESCLDSGNVLAYFLYSDQLRDAEQIDAGIRKLINDFQF